jgi:hypothetical protein
MRHIQNNKLVKLPLRNMIRDSSAQLLEFLETRFGEDGIIGIESGDVRELMGEREK